MRLSHLIITSMFLLGVVPTSGAQTVRGRVLEAATNIPVPSAHVILISDRGTAAASGLTDDNGRFLLTARRPGRYMLVARRLGFRPRADAVQLGDDELEIDVRVAPIPVTLDPVTIEAEVNARYLELVGFFTRQRADFGHFITRDQIEERRAVRVSDVLNTVPGVRLAPDGEGLGKVRVVFRGATTQFGGPCEPRVFIDGLIAMRGDAKPSVLSPGGGLIDELNQEDPRDPEPAVDDVVDPNDIEAIEVYRSGVQVPAEFGGMGPFTRCGAIVIWTRRGR